MKRLLLALFLVCLITTALPADRAYAAAPSKNKGLLITPLRQYVHLNAGSQQNSSFTIANLTQKPITVNLSVKQFSVSDYIYDYRFSDPDNTWLTLGTTRAELMPNKSQTIAYTIAVPPHTAPGGHYYTLFASTNLSDGALGGTVQAATLLYVTVDGSLIKTSELRASSTPHIVFGKNIPYTLDTLNTGNIYYFVYVSGRLQGLLGSSGQAPITHLLLPHAVRRIRGDIRSPLLPGFYKVTYGYKTDSGERLDRSQLVLFIPPWSIALFILLVLAGGKFLQRKHQPSRTAAKQAKD